MSALTVRRHNRSDGLVEVVLKLPNGETFAVIERQCPGAKWFLHFAGPGCMRGQPFRTWKAALDTAEQVFQQRVA